VAAAVVEFMALGITVVPAVGVRIMLADREYHPLVITVVPVPVVPEVGVEDQVRLVLQ
jgi:hypothetical protein